MIASYLDNDDRRFLKERMEVFEGGAVAVEDNFARVELIQRGRQQDFRSWLQQKSGYTALWIEFMRAMRKDRSQAIPVQEQILSILAIMANKKAT